MGDENKATGPAQSAIREFIVEFLGSLVPGIAFLIAMIPGIVVPVGAVVVSTLGLSEVSLPHLNGTPPSVGTIMFLLFPALMGFFVFAYIAGALFYRQNPKAADEASFRRISNLEQYLLNRFFRWLTQPAHRTLWWRVGKTRLGFSGGGEEKGKTEAAEVATRTDESARVDGMVRKVVTEDKNGNRREEMPVEFPYHCLREYLTDRGLIYLAERIPWSGQKADRRSKHFANALKLRIQATSPEGSAILARNEAHIRLSSSMWYVCIALICFSALGLLLLIFGWAAFRIAGAGELPLQLALFPTSVFVFYILTKMGIERALHYQREREILFILEIAHWLYATGKADKMFLGLEPASEAGPLETGIKPASVALDVTLSPNKT